VNAGNAGSGGHVDGHSGYDWSMPIGTKLFAVAAGTVTQAFLTHPPVYCRAQDRNVTDNATIEIEHTLTDGTKVRSRYIHVNTISVAVGAAVTAGQQIGNSGNRGCSFGPHLHFEVMRKVGTSWRLIDPYGWTSATTDPWTTHMYGAASINLWASGAAPPLYREKYVAPNTGGSQAKVTITKVRWMGVNDGGSLNNEFLELTLDTRYSTSESLAGYQIKGDRANFTFNLPSTASLSTANPTIRIKTGIGTNTPTTLFMGRSAPAWSNDFNDCARRLNTNVAPPLEYKMSLGGAC
jgi:murein DD-endopeptidase MepM/ murein hydrolase activator NlpD